MAADALVGDLRMRFPGWDIGDLGGGGWWAVRRERLPESVVLRGRANVRCGSTLRELAAHLAEETRLDHLAGGAAVLRSTA